VAILLRQSTLVRFAPRTVLLSTRFEESLKVTQCTDCSFTICVAANRDARNSISVLRTSSTTVPSTLPEARVEHSESKIEAVKAEIEKVREIKKQLPTVPEGKISITDPDARSMNSAGKGTGIVGYNMQTAVGYQEPLDRGARGHELGQRPNSSDADAEVSTRNDGQEAP
jgi:hypothetical protein